MPARHDGDQSLEQEFGRRVLQDKTADAKLERREQLRLVDRSRQEDRMQAITARLQFSKRVEA